MPSILGPDFDNAEDSFWAPLVPLVTRGRYAPQTEQRNSKSPGLVGWLVGWLAPASILGALLHFSKVPPAWPPGALGILEAL